MMGLYDTIVCDYPITGGLPDWIKKHPFQTKDLDCQMEEYKILTDGSFSDSSFTGILNFYADNVVGSGPGIYTENGEDAEYLDCVAKIIDGKLAGEIKVGRKSHKAWAISKMSMPKMLDEELINKMKQRQAESLIGRRLYVLWGGQDNGYWVKVIAENDRQLCVQHENESKHHLSGDFELIDRYHRDHIFFDSDTEALDRLQKRTDDWNRQKEEFEKFKIG